MGTSQDRGAEGSCVRSCWAQGTPPHPTSQQRTVAPLPCEFKPGQFWVGGKGLPEGEVVQAWLPAPCVPKPKSSDS